MKILLIEDDDLDARAIERQLSRLWSLNCDLIRARNLGEGLALAETERPDVALLDLHLPDSRGLNSVPLLVERMPGQPVIVLTGDSDEVKDVPALAAGAADYLIKGEISADSLARALRHSMERKRSEQRIREQAELLDRANEGIVACAATGEIGYSNAGAHALLGPLKGKNLFESLGFSETRIEGLLDELRSKGGAVIEVELPTAAGPTVHQVSRWSRSADTQSEPARELIAILVDITERRKLNARMREAQKLESLGALAGGIAHDFNNLLAAIMGNVGLVKAETPDSSEEWEMLTECESAAERAADLCSQMLAYAGKGRLVSQPVDLGALTADLADWFRISLDKRIELDVRMEGNLPEVTGDSAQLRRMFTNLMINASEAIGDSGGEINVSGRRVRVDAEYLRRGGFVSELPPGEYASVCVSDTGSGMDAKTLEKIFDPFFSTKFTGRGLGLASVQGIVRVHEGALSARSRPDEGSSFEILLPAATLPEIHEPPTLPSMKEALPPLDGSKGAILVVDDEEPVRKTARRILSRTGCEIILARDGAEGALEFERRAPDLKAVLLDLTMPHMDGVEAHKLMRSLNPDVPVLVMSGYTEQAVSERFGAAGPAGFLHKPFRAEELLAKVRPLIAP